MSINWFICYFWGRVLPGDLKVAFVGPGQGQNFEIDENVFGDKIENNDTKG